MRLEDRWRRDVPQWLALMLVSRAWTQVEAAAASEMCQKSISFYLHGERRPTTEQCRKLARAFAVPILDVLEVAGHVTRDERDDGFRDDLDSGRFDEECRERFTPIAA